VGQSVWAVAMLAENANVIRTPRVDTEPIRIRVSVT
jgi:hypothetical protein